MLFFFSTMNVPGETPSKSERLLLRLCMLTAWSKAWVLSISGPAWVAMQSHVGNGWKPLSSHGNNSLNWITRQCVLQARPQTSESRLQRFSEKCSISLQTQPRLVTRLWFHFSFLFFTTDYKTSNSQSLNWKWGWWYSLTHLVQAPLMLVRSWTVDASWTAISQIFKKQRREYLEFYIARIDCCEHKPQVCIVTQKFRSLSSNGRFRQTQCSLIFTRSRDLHLEMSNSTPPQTSGLTCSTPNMSNCFSFSFERKLKERKRGREKGIDGMHIACPLEVNKCRGFWLKKTLWVTW